MPELLPTFDRAKVERALRAVPLISTSLTFYGYDGCQYYCALGALCHAAGMSDEQLRKIDKRCGGAPVPPQYEAAFGELLETEYGIPRTLVEELYTANDEASDEDEDRVAAVLYALDLEAGVDPQVAMARRFPVGRRVALRYFPVTGTVARIDADARVWVAVDQAVLDTEAGETAPVAVRELRLLPVWEAPHA